MQRTPWKYKNIQSSRKEWKPIHRHTVQTHEGSVTYVSLLVHVWDWSGTPTTDRPSHSFDSPMMEASQEACPTSILLKNCVSSPSAAAAVAIPWIRVATRRTAVVGLDAMVQVRWRLCRLKPGARRGTKKYCPYVLVAKFIGAVLSAAGHCTV